MALSGCTKSGIALAVLVGAVNWWAAPEECPKADISCRRLVGKDSEYVCGVFAGHSVSGDPPRYYWAATGGRIINNPNSIYATIDARGVKADSILVTLSVTWPQSPPVCRTVKQKTIPLR